MPLGGNEAIRETNKKTNSETSSETSPGASNEGSQCALRNTDIDFNMSYIHGAVGQRLASFSINFGFFGPASGCVTPYAMRNYYCPECLREDIASVGFPCWRKSWTYCMTAYCFQHKRLLTVSRASVSAYERAWSAFKEEAADTPSNPFRRMRDQLAIQIQRWYFKRPGFNTLGLKNTQSSIAFFDLTFSLLLKCRTRYEGGGYACALTREYRGQILQKVMPLSERIRTGMDISIPVQRANALILTGMILGLLSPSQISKFAALARQSNVPWPSTPFEIGKMAIHYGSREEYFELRGLYSSTPESLVTRCAEFFRGLEHGVYSLRDEYSHQDREWLSRGSTHQRWLAAPEV